MKINQLISLYLVAVVLISCSKHEKAAENDAVKPDNVRSETVATVTPKKKTLADILAGLNTEDTIADLNLSHLNLNSLPDLSQYHIVELDLSYNNLDTLPLSYLPKNLKKLLCSHNRIKRFYSWNHIGEKSVYDNSDLTLSEIDLSYNGLRSFSYTVSHKNFKRDKSVINRIDLSHNNLVYVSVNCKTMNFLDISNNPLLSNVFDFYIEDVDTVVRNNIKNNLPLKLRDLGPMPNIE